VRLLRVRPEALLARRREMLAKTEYRLLRAQAGCHLRGERRLQEKSAALASASPGRLIERHAILLHQLAGRLERGAVRGLADRGRTVEGLEARLTASSHEQVLGRGFSITRRTKDGRIVRRAGDVREGDRLRTQTAEGDIASRVTDERQGELFE
jgi:exodeoxyribonuclease VII large subunit